MLAYKTVLQAHRALTAFMDVGRSNWVDFVKFGCEKSWAEVQADSFSF